jgi:MarR family transcriptional regulator, 2-MHQ and catechol-resistance regulon repressor
MTARPETVTGVHLWLILMKAFHSIMAATANDFSASGLGDSDFRVLEVLLHKGPLPVNAIGPKVFLTPGSISTAVDRLHRKGLVSRTGSLTDRRVHVVDLTKSGRTLITKVFNAHAAHLERLASVLSPRERVQLTNALKKLGIHAENVC